MSEAGSPDHPYLAQIRLQYARALVAIARWAEAEALLRALLAAGEGESRPALADVRIELAAALLGRGDSDSAAELVRTVLGANPTPAQREKAEALQTKLLAGTPSGT